MDGATGSMMPCGTGMGPGQFALTAHTGPNAARDGWVTVANHEASPKIVVRIGWAA
jgi:hypothetical protein